MFKFISKKSAKAFLLTAMCATASVANAQNPYMPLWEFIPDGEPYVFDDPDKPGKKRVYVYGSHDNLLKVYCGRDQVVWSAPVEDLTNWRFDGTIFESKTDAKGKNLNQDGVGDVLYAPDVTVVTDANGKKTYYLYPNVQHDKRNSLVAKSDRPDGPFVVCNWKSDKADETQGPFAFDPACFVDDDGRVYGYWGFERSYAAELDPTTMATVKPGAKIIEDMIPGRNMDQTYRFFEASSIRKIKDKYVFIYSRFTNDGEFGLPTTNYTLAYCWSNNPLGPWTYGGTIIDGRGREKQPDGTMMATACPGGNTHGSICEINGKWWVFYHRQAGTNEYNRQAMVAPIEVEVREGKDGYVRISEGELTSEGFMTEGLDPYKQYAAGIACYYTGPKPSVQEYPNVTYYGSHTNIHHDIKYDGKMNPFDESINKCEMVNNTAGSVVGYKYFNFKKTYGRDNLSLVLNIVREGITGSIDVYLDRPSEEQGGVKIGTVALDSTKDDKASDITIPVAGLKNFNGKHALFLVFNSQTKEKAICTINTLRFK